MKLQATKVFKGGTVITMDNLHTVAEAVAINGNKILAVGSEKEIQSLIDSNTEIEDLKGAVLLPGFYDSHGHIHWYAGYLGGVNLNSPPIGGIKTINELTEAVKMHADSLPENKWILGWGYDDTRLEEKRHPTRFDLDKISAERPICLNHISNHLCVLNSKALELVGFNKETSNPEGGILQRDPITGELNGVIEETALYIVDKVKPRFTDDEIVDLLAQAGNVYASRGVTTAKEDGAFFVKAIEDVRRCVMEKELNIRVSIVPTYAILEELGSYEKLRNYIQEIKEETDQISISGIKMLYDGSIQGYTAYLSQPYYVPYKGDEDYRGYATMPKEKLIELVKEIHNYGDQVVIHTNGDAATEDVLDAITLAQEANPRKDLRHIIIHCQTVREDQLDRMEQLNVHPSFFAPHIYYWGDRHKSIFLGPERANRISPISSAIERGLIPSIHCDTPVTPQNPLLAMGIAVNRRTYGGEILGFEQRIAVWDALKALTINAAWQFSEEKYKGSIEVGKLADFVVLEENPFLVEPTNIENIRVLKTIVGGKTVYEIK